MHDLDKLEMAIVKMGRDMQVDGCPDATFRLFSWAPPLRAVGIRQVKYPGYGLDPNLPF